MKKVKLDEKDLKILRDLEKDGKKSLKEISDALKLSMTSVFERIKKMEKSKIIKGYKAILDKERLDKGSTAFVLAKATVGNGSSLKEIAENISKIKGVSEIFIVVGRWNFVVKVRGKDEKETSGIMSRLGTMPCEIAPNHPTMLPLAIVRCLSQIPHHLMWLSGKAHWV